MKPKQSVLAIFKFIAFIFLFFFFIYSDCLAQNCSSSDLTMLSIPSCSGATNFNSGTSSPLNIDNGQTACTNVSNATFSFNTVNMTPNSNGGSNLIITNNNNVTINTLTIQNNNNNANITIYVASGSTLTIQNSLNTPSRVRIINYGIVNFASGTTWTVQNDNNLFQNAFGATMNFNGTLNFASGNNTRFINNGTVNISTMTINSNGVRYIQGNSATTTVSTLSQNNQTDVLCVPSNNCAKFTVTTAIPQLNNQLTSSNGSNSANDRGQQIVCYQGTAGNYRGGSVSFPTGVGSAFSTDCATNCPIIVLPVRLLYFSANRTGQTIHLTWATTQEENNQSFEIQRSRNGVDFKTIGEVRGKADTQIKQEYDFFDTDFPNAQLYYRLKQIDLDGTITYFKMVEVSANVSEGILFTIFPNPAQKYAEIHFNKPLRKAEIKVFNLQGNLILYTFYNFDSQIFTINTADFLEGFYLVQIATESNLQTQKLLIAE